MNDILEGPITLPLGGKNVQFGRIRFRHVSASIDFANAALLRTAFDAMPEATAAERADIIRRVGKTYSINDVETVLADPANCVHLLWLSYNEANPGSNKTVFLDLIDLEGLSGMQAWIDQLAGFGQQPETDNNPPV